MVTASGLSDEDDHDAWSAIADHVSATSEGHLVLVKPPVGHVLTSASGAQLASYGFGVGKYTGPIELIFTVQGTDGRLVTIAAKGSTQAMGGVNAVFDLATRRLVQFTPSTSDEFVADDPSAFEELGAIERSCYKIRD